MKTFKSVDHYVKIYGEGHRRLISDALRFVEERQSIWKLDQPGDMDLYIKSLMEMIAKKP
jgi:hypothetical protein